MAHFEARVALAAPRETVFDYIIRPDNAARLTAPQAGLKFFAAPDPFTAGCKIHLELTGLGPTQKMIYEVTKLVSPEYFVEVQTQGPLKSFRQEHLLEDVPGGTMLIEQVHFEPPGGMLGFLVTADRIKSGLVSGFEYRHTRLVEQFGQLS